MNKKMMNELRELISFGYYPEQMIVLSVLAHMPHKRKINTQAGVTVMVAPAFFMFIKLTATNK